MPRSEDHRADAEECRRLAANSLNRKTITSLHQMAALYDALAIRAKRTESGSSANKGQ
jgi:hypothetical protein